MIAFCSPKQFMWQALLELKLYIDRVQADGIITKLDRLCNALNYLMLKVEEFEKKREDIIIIKSRNLHLKRKTTVKHGKASKGGYIQ